MDAQSAQNLVKTYVDGWRRNDAPAIISTLDPHCTIIESHGPTYRGIEMVRQWVGRWFAAGSRIDRWDITSFHFLNDVAAFEWEFVCTVEGQSYRLDGISLVEFAEDKIVALREYRRTEQPFDWEGDL